MLRIFLLGSFRAEMNDHILSGFRYAKVRALLAYLVMYANKPISRCRLAGMLWPDVPDQIARGNLRNAVFYLRKALGQIKPWHDEIPRFLQADRSTIWFTSSDDFKLDVADYEKYLSDSEEGRKFADRQQMILKLEEAIALYGGNFMEDIYIDSTIFEEWIDLERDRLQQQLITALYELANLHEEIGEYQKAQHYARLQLEIEPYRECAHQQLIRILFHCGQRGASLAQFHLCQKALAMEFGVAPNEETLALYNRVANGSSQKKTAEQAVRWTQPLEGAAIHATDKGALLPHYTPNNPDPAG